MENELLWIDPEADDSGFDGVRSFDRAVLEAGATAIALGGVDLKGDRAFRNGAVGALGFASSAHNAFIRIDDVFGGHENNPFDW